MITECRDASLKEHKQPNVAGTLNLHLSWVVKCCAKCCALKAFNEKEAVLFFFMILNRKQSKLKYHMLSKNHTLKSYQGLCPAFIRLLMFLLLMLANNVPTHSPSSMGIRYASELGALWATNITAKTSALLSNLQFAFYCIKRWFTAHENAAQWTDCGSFKWNALVCWGAIYMYLFPASIAIFKKCPSLKTYVQGDDAGLWKLNDIAYACLFTLVAKAEGANKFSSCLFFKPFLRIWRRRYPISQTHLMLSQLEVRFVDT